MAGTTEKGSVAIAFVIKAVAALRRRGVDELPILRAVGIQPHLLQSEHSRVPAAAYSALWLAVASALDDEFFDLDSRRVKVGSFATLCRLTVHAGNLREALNRAIGFFNLLLDDTQLRLEPRGELVRIGISHPTHRVLPDQVFAHETLLVLLHGVLCWLVGRRIIIRQAQFGYTRPQWWREYLAMYSTDLRFAQPQTCILIDAAYLDVPVKQNEKTAREFLRSAPYNIILKYKDDRSWALRIRRRLRNTQPANWPNFEQLADELKVASSTLHRRLEAEGESFQRIKDELRRDMAINHLSDGNESVAEIAAALGFAETSAFHRAFKQWTGVSPGDYRRAPKRR